MKSQSEILRFVDTIHRDKEIDKEAIFEAIEAAYLSSVKKKFGESETIRVEIDRESGDIQIFDGETPLEVEDLGRIAATTGKQVLFQKIREAERDVIFDEYASKVGQLVTGVVQRMEGPNMIVSLGKVEGFLPKSEQVPGEKFRVGDRIKVLVHEIKKNANRVRIILSRAHTDLVKLLFALEVPEINDKTIEIMGIAREPGYRTKIAVTTYDHNVDCVGACVGVRGSRIKNIVDELFGEKIDIVRWNESIEVLIMNALKPAEISSMDLDFDETRARVYVKPDQQSIAIGKRGQNVRLASKLTGWDIDIVMVSDEELEKLRTEEIDAEGKPISIGVMGEISESVAAEAPVPTEATEERPGEEVGTVEPAATDESADDEPAAEEVEAELGEEAGGAAEELAPEADEALRAAGSADGVSSDEQSGADTPRTDEEPERPLVATETESTVDPELATVNAGDDQAETNQEVEGEELAAPAGAETRTESQEESEAKR